MMVFIANFVQKYKPKQLMNNKTLIVGACLAVAGSLNAQNKDGGISLQMLQQIQQHGKQTTAERAIANAIATNSIDELARTPQSRADVDAYFSVETPKQNIQNQKSSGRCWMFTGLNVLRADFALRSDSLTVEYSHTYLFFYDQLEKANLMLQSVVDCAKKPINDPEVQFFFKHPLNDGGTFCGVADLAEKYGLVPKSVMPETYSSENSNRMSKLISSKLREFGLELRKMVAAKAKPAQILERKTQMLATVYKMLALTLGEPVKSFEYAFKNKEGKAITPVETYTPKQFYDKTVGRSLNDNIIMVMNDPRNAYYKVYEVKHDRHTYDGHNWRYLNLPMEEIHKMAIASLKAGHKMYSSYDVGKQLDRSKGYLDLNNFDYGPLFGTTFPMNKADRIATFDSGSTHAMTLTAVDLDTQGKALKWEVENSWGADNGHKGYLIMSNNWFNEFFFRLVVDKQYVSADIQKMAAQTPIMLSYDDPVFADDL